MSTLNKALPKSLSKEQPSSHGNQSVWVAQFNIKWNMNTRGVYNILNSKFCSENIYDSSKLVLLFTNRITIIINVIIKYKSM